MIDTLHYRIHEDTDDTILSRDGGEEWSCTNENAARIVALREAQSLAREQSAPLVVTIDGPSGTQTFDVDEHAVTEQEPEPEPEPSREPAPDLATEIVGGQAPTPADTPEPSPRVAHTGAYKITLPRPALPRLNDGSGLSSVPTPVKVAAGVAAAFLVLGAAATGLRHDDPAPAAQPAPTSTATTSSPATTGLPPACVGGNDPITIAQNAGALATGSTIQQAGLTVPSPSGAAAAAAAFARLRLTQPAPATQAAAYYSTLAADATPAARTLPPAPKPGWTTKLDMTQARWQIVAGNGSNADVALLLVNSGTYNGKPAAPTPFALKVSLKLVNGTWRLRDVGASPLTVVQLQTAPLFDPKACA